MGGPGSGRRPGRNTIGQSATKKYSRKIRSTTRKKLGKPTMTRREYGY